MIETSRLDRRARSGCVLSRRRCAPPRTATHARLGGPGQWLLDAAAVVRRRPAGALPLGARRHRAGRPRGGHSRALDGADRAGATSPWCPTQLHRLLGDADEVEALRGVRRRAASAAARSTPTCAAAAEARGRPGRATYGMSETCGGCVYDGLPARRRRGRRSATDGRIRIGGPVLFDGYDGEPEPTARVLVRRLVPSPTTSAGSTTTAGCRCSAASTTWSISGGVNVPAAAVAARLREHPAVRGGRGASACPTTEWGERVVAVVVGDADARRRCATGSPSAHPRAWAPRQRRARRRAAAARQRQGRPAAAVREAGARCAEPHVFSIPMRTRFRGITVREGVLLARRRPGWGEFSPFLEYDAAVAAPWLRVRPRGRRRAAGRRRCATRVPVNVTVPAVGPEQAHAIVRARGGCRTAKVKVAEPGQTLGRRRRPGSRRSATRSGPTGRIRVDANGGWDVDEAVARDPAAGPGRRRPGVRRAAVRRASRTSPPYAAGSTCRSPPTSRSAGPRTPTGCATSRPPTSRCSRCSRSAGCAPACGSPRTSGCRSWSPAPLETERRHRRRGRAGGGAARAAATPAGSPRCSCSPTTCVAEPLLPVDGALPVRPPGRRTPAALAAARRRRRPGGALATRGWPRSGRAAGSSPVNAVDRAGDRAVVDELVAARRPRGWCSRPGSRNAPLSFAAYDAADAGPAPAAHPHRRAHRRLPRPRAGQGRRAGRSRSSRPRGTAVANLHPAVLEAAHAGVPLVVRHRRPARPAARHRRQPDHRPGRHLRRRVGCADRSTCPPTRRRRARRGSWRRSPQRSRVGGSTARPVHLNVQLDDPLVPDAADGWAARSTARREGDPWIGAGDRRDAAAELARRAARARSWWPATTPGRRRGCWPRRAGWPLLAEPTSGSRTGDERDPHLPAAARRPTSADRIERVVVVRPPDAVAAGQPAAGPRRRRGRRRWPRRRSLARAPVTPVDRVEHERGRGATAPTTPRWLEEWRDGGPPTVGRRSTRCSPPSPALTPHDVAGAVSAAVPAGRPAVRRRLQPDPRPRPDGRRATPVGERRDGDRQPRPRRHRRHRLHRDRRRARPAARRPRPRAARRRDVPARRQRPGARPRRAAARPDDRGGQRRRRLDLRHPRAGRAASTPTSLRPALRHPARRRPRQPLRGHPDAALAGRLSSPSSSTRWPARTAASRSSRPSSAATTGASWTPRSARWPRPDRQPVTGLGDAGCTRGAA